MSINLAAGLTLPIEPLADLVRCQMDLPEQGCAVQSLPNLQPQSREYFTFPARRAETHPGVNFGRGGNECHQLQQRIA
jgi:hypothetical protein